MKKKSYLNFYWILFLSFNPFVMASLKVEAPLKKLKPSVSKLHEKPALLVSSKPGEAKKTDPLSISSPRRVSMRLVDWEQVHLIALSPGMVTSIEIPDVVTGIRLGDPESIKCDIPGHPPNEVTVILQHAKATPTNLIIRSGKKKYVFDLVPSSRDHQDVIEIVGGYGGPQMEGSSLHLIDSSE